MGWLMTFADLMTLLMAFFVLLFSFSELDRNKYKEVAGSLRDAFGVQQSIHVRDPPKGINVVAREFSPGIPTPTPLNEVRQFTTSDSRPYPMLFDSKEIAIPLAPGVFRYQLDDEERLRQALQPEIDEGLIELQMVDNRIILRIRERGFFPSGSGRLEPDFEPIIQRLGDTLVQTSGTIVVAGHTDSIPIRNSLFRSNWELSAARALTVIRVFLDRSESLASRMHLEAYAEHRPMDVNDTPDGRANNRRVEISLVYPNDPVDPTHVPSPAPPDQRATEPAGNWSSDHAS